MSNNGWKTCTRGHKFRGARCATCWPGGAKKPSKRRLLLFMLIGVLAAACGADRGKHVGPPLGDTHVSQGPADPTVPPPDAAVAEEPTRSMPITAPQGPAPTPPVPESQQPAPQPAPQPGVFSPPPAPSGPPDISQPEIPKP